MPPVETDEDIKEGKRLKTWTPNKLLITLSTLLAQKKARHNSYKSLKYIRNLVYLLY